MSFVFLISVFLKGLGAILEILLQVTITKTAGLSIYGTYSAWINSADLIFWCLFSGIVKCNTFYLSGKNGTINNFKKKYYGNYVLPVSLGTILFSLFLKKDLFWLVVVIAIIEVVVLDQSSTLLANGRYMYSLIGEYILGRIFLFIAVLVIRHNGDFTISKLMFAYLLQYIITVFFFAIRCKQKDKEDISQAVSVKKWKQYQKADVFQAIVSQMPVILQYLCSGGFEAGVVSIVLLIKKLINFISGPAAKIFLPEFSRLYRQGQQEEICSCFASIMRIQMMIVGPLAVVLIGYPKVVLGILGEELVAYSSVFAICSVVFLVATSLGPCGGLLQMTGAEKMDNICREIAIVGMLVTFLVMRVNPLFVVYGLCVQTFLESTSKFVVVCKRIKQIPVSIIQYMGWWILPLGTILLTYLLEWQNSFLHMALLAGINFLFRAIKELKNRRVEVRKK